MSTDAERLATAEREAATAREHARLMGEVLVEHHDVLVALSHEWGRVDTDARAKAMELLSGWPGRRS